MRRPLLWLAVVWTALAFLGCGGSAETVTIGTKSFTEQAIVAQLARQLLHAETRLRAEVVECGDSFECQEALGAGRIDLMVEYSGTAALYLGLDPADPEAVPAIERLYGERGLQWRPPLGFDNSYRLAVSTATASRLGLASIVHLSKVPGGIRVACPRTYLRRPRDGLAALTERHGLRLRGDALLLDSPSERIDAVLAGRADVAVVYGTDGALRNGGITLLLDSLDFFPGYEAAWLVRRDALAHFAGLEATLERLEGQLDAAVMQELNYAAQIEGWKPANVARRFLVSRDLLQGGATAPAGRLKLVLAVLAADELAPQRTRATRALRQVFPDRPVEVRETAEPVELVAKGSAKLALLGAEHFFEARDGGFQRTLALEAVAVVGSRTVHLLRAGPAPDRGAPGEEVLAGRVGISPPASGAGKIGLGLLATMGAAPAVTAPVDQLLAQLGQGSLDAALIVAELGAPAVTQAIEEHRAHLVSLPGQARAGGIPYLRRTRVPTRTYAGQDGPVETLAVQVVLAGPSRRPQWAALHPGPGAALLMEASPLPVEEVRLLAEATGVPEWPDPVLPVAWTSLTAAARPDTSSAVLTTVLNVAVLAFLAWLTALVLRSPRRSDDDGDGTVR